MKRLALLAFALVMACGDDGGNPPVGAGTMTATVDGSSFSGTYSVTASRSGTSLNVAAVGSNSRSLSINLTGVTAPGTIAIGAGSASVGTYSLGTQAFVSNVAGGTGSVVLTTLSSTRAVGTFSFTGVAGTATKGVTNGTFDVSY